ncbi:transcriptional regulator [Streptococcus pyogenes]|nr:transcriptional regulator [Streptococcus pyogenes]VHJ90528.1 transcriptional regulator [Streptococcus pyogenes]VHK23106.1 transcriptional regulator [Streptococcus pyogenes]VHK42101.1 transcriptional regulator [Streptococcus pyogenes]VHL07009.1 transcriptional regulator [Streptococcus pyogenes]
MEIGQQIIRYRKQQALSQEKLVEKVYVSRQSISNWENDKTYPDIHSLLLLSQIFQVSLDQLIKGDIEKTGRKSKTSLSETPYCHCIFPHYCCHLFCKSFYVYMVIPLKLVDNKIKLSVTLGFILVNSIQQ